LSEILKVAQYQVNFKIIDGEFELFYLKKIETDLAHHFEAHLEYKHI
jgi:hypothetical protein